MTPHRCPLCRLPMASGAGMVVEGRDYSTPPRPFLIVLCGSCARAIHRLPPERARVQMRVALSTVAKAPEGRYPYLVVDETAAAILCGLAGDPNPAIAQSVVDLVLEG